MKAIALTLSMLAMLACGPSCAASQAVERQAPAAAACLPMALPRILACHDGGPTKEVLCLVMEVSSLAACWTGHQPPATPNPTNPTATANMRLVAAGDSTLIDVQMTLHTPQVDVVVQVNGLDPNVDDIPQPLVDALAQAWRQLTAHSL